jgi:PAB-dependent poly(A)-specific ribonuclease subunit 3
MLSAGYDPFSSSQTMSTLAGATSQMSLGQYPQDPATVQQAGYFPNSGAYGPLLNYHLYAPMAPHRETLKPWQRTAHDFFIPDHLREDLQRKADASRQILPNSQLPTVDHFHSLVPLDTNNHRNASVFGYPNLLYKAVSEKDGKTYALRRIEGYKLTKAEAIESTKQLWRKIDHGGVVRVHDCFTTRAFQDSASSLIFVTDYHPLARTLVEQYPTYPQNRYGTRQSRPEESLLWGYIVQIASALKIIHNNKLAARVLHPSKIIVTSKGRVRLSGCAILDVVQYDPTRGPAEALIADQQQDLVYFGQVIFYITNTATHPKPLESLGHVYSTRLKDAVAWLINAGAPPTPLSPLPDGTPQYQPHRSIDEFLMHIYSEVTTVMDNAFHAEDTMTSYLALELENGRMFRLLSKLGFINERPEQDPTTSQNAPPHPPSMSLHSPWSETGDRYYLKLFRDYVFHQVDGEGKPVVDLAHVISCMNKLDAGSEEKICLMDRAESNVFVLSYRELKRYVESAFQELISGAAGRGGRR